MEIFSRFPKKRFRGFTPLKNKIAKFPKNGKLYIFQKMEIFSRFPKKRFRGFTPLKNKIAKFPKNGKLYSGKFLETHAMDSGRSNRRRGTAKYFGRLCAAKTFEFHRGDGDAVIARGRCLVGELALASDGTFHPFYDVLRVSYLIVFP